VRVVVLLVLSAGAACVDPPAPDAGIVTGARVVVTKDGDGTGVVTSDPDGVACDLDCDQAEGRFPAGKDGAFDGADARVATLEFAPARDALFFGWTCTTTIGGAERTFESAGVNIDVPVDVDGEEPTTECTLLVRAVALLQVIRTGTGTGTVAGAAVTDGAARIDCGDDCQGAYFLDEVETLTATADPGSTFARWRLDCDGTAPVVDVTLDGQKTCEAEFTLAE
jgi:hypothetical protein